jgi:1-acyl-sn-glycerol-3-phosphate acyltransferase
LFNRATRLVTVNLATFAMTVPYACTSMASLIVKPDGSGYHATARAWSRAILGRAGIRVRHTGLDRVDWSKPSIVMANHASLYDIPALFLTLPIGLNFLSKKELKYIPFLGWSMWAAGFVFIDRGDSEKARMSIDEAAAKVGSGTSVVIFPEGTRSKDGVLKRFKKGGFVLAIKSRAQIVPVWIEGSFEALPKDHWHVNPGEVVVAVGAPIDPSRFALTDKDALMDEVRGALEALADEQRAARAVRQS